MTTSNKDRGLEILNKVKDYVVADCNKRGINLSEHFDSVEKFKDFIFALTFKTLTDAGVPVGEVHDLLLGEGSYDKLVEQTWNNANGIA